MVDVTVNDSKVHVPTALELQLGRDETTTRELPVRISFEIIRLFSEGLYQSPHKAIEELVSNSYDAGASKVWVVTPRTGGDAPNDPDSLWVIDNGAGMDAAGFSQLWLVAESEKAGSRVQHGRSPIGQFGIGKLAAYVLAWRLTHISKRDGTFYYTTMDFHQVINRRQNDPDSKPVKVGLVQIDEARSRELLAEIEMRDPDAWEYLFGEDSPPSWTAAALSDFKELFDKFRPGVLSWVLRTGLPLFAEFSIYLNGERLEPSKESAKLLLEIPIGSDGDDQAKKLGFKVTPTGVQIPGIQGEVKGIARLYETPLTKGKSLQYGRSHGFFIRVRGRVINLEDELFGVEALNHATWSRFAMEVEADGLREFLLSSREGVRETEPVLAFKDYLKAVFNACRAYFDKETKRDLVGLDIEMLLENASSSVLADPLVEAVRQALAARRQPSHYISAPVDISDEETGQWLKEFEQAIAGGPFEKLTFKSMGPYDRLAEYDAATRELKINAEHPFIAKILAHSKNQTPATLFATSEIITDGLIREAGIDPAISLELFVLRDRALRQIAGDFGPDPADVLRHLQVADQDKDALEKAVGEAFITMGFSYDRRGGNRGGADGVLDARLGRGEIAVDDFRVVYDAKTTSGSSISVGKVDLTALWDFKNQESADHGFIIGKRFDGQADPASAVNRRTVLGSDDRPLTVMVTAQLLRLVQLHYRYGVTMTKIRGLFMEALTVAEVGAWLDGLEAELSKAQPEVPIKRLLLGLEAEKSDRNSRPNIIAVRAKDEALKQYRPDRLVAVLKAVETIVGSRWFEVNEVSYDVRMNQAADQILMELDRRSQDDLGLSQRPHEA